MNRPQRAPAQRSGKPARGRAGPPPPRRSAAGEWLRSIIIALALFLVIRTFIVEAFRIPTGSMENTLLVGDFLLVNKLSYGLRIPFTHVRLFTFRHPQLGDIVVFRPPHEQNMDYVKRIVGLAGDTLMMRNQVLYRNGEPLQEPYARHIFPDADVTHPDMNWQYAYLVPSFHPNEYRPSRDNWGPLVVPVNSAFVMGDNRDDSEDSRFWGFVDEGEIRGRPLFIYYSFDSRSLRPLPFITAIRWNRIGSLIR
jgi:signal peptidase I